MDGVIDGIADELGIDGESFASDVADLLGDLTRSGLATTHRLSE